MAFLLLWEQKKRCVSDEQKFVVVLADGTFQRLMPKWCEQ
ncbi:hypothetical protein B4119_0431 [Parageobacillus caldoxylosilyticus]|uniref:Uncharacterized protein n=1 Tax=Saccharococcus caldoxylosilyticus TaxID=81408 RepID=A0A150KU53_9BACL|nr:hypothetical protein B4119_0431 [Parageobacillus caldoxylosilyticus]